MCTVVHTFSTFIQFECTFREYHLCLFLIQKVSLSRFHSCANSRSASSHRNSHYRTVFNLVNLQRHGVLTAELIDNRTCFDSCIQQWRNFGREKYVMTQVILYISQAKYHTHTNITHRALCRFIVSAFSLNSSRSFSFSLFHVIYPRLSLFSMRASVFDNGWFKSLVNRLKCKFFKEIMWNKIESSRNYRQHRKWVSAIQTTD